MPLVPSGITEPTLRFHLNQIADAFNKLPPLSVFSFTTPESNVTAQNGTLGINLNTSAATRIWFKETGDGNTGWSPITEAGATAQHVLATTTAIGPSHTVSGLTVGTYLRAISATDVAFQAIVAGDLPTHTHAASQITSGTLDYARLPTGGGIWVNGGTLSITGGVTTVAGLTSTDEVIANSGGANTQIRTVGTGLGGINFGSGQDTNIYRSAANTLKTDDAFEVAGELRGLSDVLIGGSAILGGGAPNVFIGGTVPRFHLYHSNASLDQKLYRLGVDSDGVLLLQAINDAVTVGNYWLRFTRSGATPTLVAAAALFQAEADILVTHIGSCRLTYNSTDAAADKKKWRTYSTAAGQWVLDALNDAESAANSAVTIDRSGTTPSLLTVTPPMTVSGLLTASAGVTTALVGTTTAADTVIQRNSAAIITAGASAVTLGVNTLTNGNADFVLQRNAATILTLAAARATVAFPVGLKSYTVAALPAGAQGDLAYVTDALTPAFLTAVVGGGAVVTPVFYDGTNWVSV